MTLKILLKSKPTAQKRPRFLRNGIVYDSQKREKQLIKEKIKEQLLSHKMIEDKPLKVQMLFCSEMPKSYSKKKKDRLEGKLDTRHYDIDNFIKLYFDIMNNFIYKDDSQICEVYAKKVYSRESSVEIILDELDDM